MKIRLCFLTLILFAALCLSGFAVAETSGDYEYSVNEDGSITITKYTGNETELTIPPEIDGYAVTRIGVRAFSSNNSVESIVIPHGIYRIDESAFIACRNLRFITLPDSLLEIGDWAFSQCGSLRVLNMPNSVTKIGSQAFNYTSIQTIEIPDSVTDIGLNPFENCTYLYSVKVSPENETFAVIDNVLFSKTDKRLICYPCGIVASSYNVPQGIQIIGGYAFNQCDLVSVTIPNSCSVIEECAFSESEELRKVSIERGITAIGDSAFAYCTSLDDISIPDSVTTISDFAFMGCSSLSAMITPEGVTEIGKCAFCDCLAIRSILIPISVTSIGEDAFSWSEQLVVTVERDSYAAEYCKNNNVPYTYPDSTNWLDN